MNTVFITGGTSGIGLELAKIYLNKGWRVGVCGRDSSKFKANFHDRRDNVTYYEVDVADRAKLQEAIKDFARPTGLNLMIASAGISYSVKSKVPDFERTYQMVNVNLLGVMYAFESALEIMIPQGKGQLVAISSLAGFRGFPGVSGYSATKAGVIRFCESLSVDLGHLGISVSCVCPGFVDTPLTQVNQHPMPSLMSAERAAQRIFKGIQKQEKFIVFPFMFGMFVRLLGVIPRSLYFYMMKSRALNYTREAQKELR